MNASGLDFDFEGESNKPSIREYFLKSLYGGTDCCSYILAYIIVYYCVEKTNVIGSSMESTLAANDPIIINKFAYRISDPKRFDVIVFKQSGKEHSFYNIKRIIGLPGETVFIKDGNIYINGEMIEEYSIVEPMINYGLAGEEISLEDNEYFVLGDNRNNSEDSRFASIGNITRDEIIGKVLYAYPPLILSVSLT